MRHPPAFQVDVKVGRAWCWALVLLLALSLQSLLWWLAGRLSAPAAATLGWLAPTIGLTLLIAYPAWQRLRRGPSQSLRWDGQHWFLGGEAERGQERRSGELHAILDFGGWMMLCFIDHAQGRKLLRRRSYLALSQADLPARWNLLRSTLYLFAGRDGTASVDGRTH